MESPPADVTSNGKSLKIRRKRRASAAECADHVLSRQVIVADKTMVRDSAQIQLEVADARVKAAVQREEAALSKVMHQTTLCKCAEKELGDALGCADSPDRLKKLLGLWTSVHMELLAKVQCEADAEIAKAWAAESMASKQAGTMVLNNAVAGLVAAEASSTKAIEKHDAAVLRSLAKVPAKLPAEAEGGAAKASAKVALFAKCRLHHPLKVELVGDEWHFKCTCQPTTRYLPLVAAAEFLPPIACQECAFQTGWHAGKKRQIEAREEMELHFIACHAGLFQCEYVCGFLSFDSNTLKAHALTCAVKWNEGYSELGYLDAAPKPTCDGDTDVVGIPLKCVNPPEVLMYSTLSSSPVELCEECALIEADLAHTMMVSEAVDDHKDLCGRWVSSGRAKRLRGP